MREVTQRHVLDNSKDAKRTPSQSLSSSRGKQWSLHSQQQAVR